MAKKILIIDDEKDMRVYLGTLFKKAGYEIESAPNGEEGFTLAQSFGPDLITLDVMMPKKSGLVLFQQLKADEQFKDIPVLMLTGALLAACGQLPQRRQQPVGITWLHHEAKRVIVHAQEIGGSEPIADGLHPTRLARVAVSLECFDIP